MTITATFSDTDPDDVIDAFGDIGAVCTVHGEGVIAHFPQDASWVAILERMRASLLAPPTWSTGVGDL